MSYLVLGYAIAVVLIGGYAIQLQRRLSMLRARREKAQRPAER